MSYSPCAGSPERLRLAQHDSGNPHIFEEELTAALKKLFGEHNVRHLGGPDSPDIILKLGERTVVVNAKTTDKKSVGESQVRWDVDEKHRRDHNAERVALVGVGFSEGNIREFAKQRGVVLVETEAFCKALTSHQIKPYEPEHLFEMTFGGNRVLITSDTIEPSTKVHERRLKILKEIIDGIKRKGKVTYSEIYYHLHFMDEFFTEDEVREAFEILTEPLRLTKEDGKETYLLDGSLDSIKEKLWLFSQAVGLGSETKMIGVGPTVGVVDKMQVTTKGLPTVYLNYKGKTYQATYSEGKITYDGKPQSPSAAAGSITGTSVNGWKAWYYYDESGNKHPIGDLRE